MTQLFNKGIRSLQAIQQYLTQCSPGKTSTDLICAEAGQIAETQKSILYKCKPMCSKITGVKVSLYAFEESAIREAKVGSGYSIVFSITAL